MRNKIQKSILAGVIGTTVMTIVTMAAPLMGFPKMSPPHMLSGMLGASLLVGWIMHFMIGIIFAFLYTCLFTEKIKINNTFVKGAVYGAIVFIFTQIMMLIMGAILPMPEMNDAMMLRIIGGLAGHIVFGVAVSRTVSKNYCTGQSCQTS